VRLGTSDATLRGGSYLRISPYIIACYEGREKPQPVALRYDMRFSDAQEELRAAQSLRDVSRNLKCLTLTRQTLNEYLSTSRILRAFADKAPNLTCLAIYENIDYVRISMGHSFLFFAHKLIGSLTWLRMASLQGRTSGYYGSSRSTLRNCRCSCGRLSTSP
jgi:hypothetical protein